MANKHEGDGHNRRILEHEVRNGVVVRRSQSDGGVPPFTDSVIVGITFGETYQRRVCFDLVSGYSEYCIQYNVAHKGTVYSGIQIHLARPYVLADSAGTSINHLTGVETYTISAARLLEAYDVIEMSTGKPATSNNRGE